MLLRYTYGKKQYSMIVNWTADSGESSVFQEVIQQLHKRRHIKRGISTQALAVPIDRAVDKLYDVLLGHDHDTRNRIFTYSSVYAYALQDAFDAVSDGIDLFQSELIQEGKELEAVTGLFSQLVDKLQQTVNVLLDDNRFHNKIRMQRYRHETSMTGIELVEEGFEDIIVQMTDLMQLLDTLKENQRRRFVLHYFLHYTAAEIAQIEGVTVSAIYYSLRAALKTIRELTVE